jgi:hypothetical protein
MIIELQFSDRSCPSEFWEITGTELTAPTVLEDKRGNFFVKAPIDQRISTTIKKYLLYVQCRGEKLSNIEIVRSVSKQSNQGEVA